MGNDKGFSRVFTHPNNLKRFQPFWRNNALRAANVSVRHESRCEKRSENPGKIIFHLDSGCPTPSGRMAGMRMNYSDKGTAEFRLLNFGSANKGGSPGNLARALPA